MKKKIRSAVLGAMCARGTFRGLASNFNKSIAHSNNNIISLVVHVGMKVASIAEKIPNLHPPMICLNFLLQ